MFGLYACVHGCVLFFQVGVGERLTFCPPVLGCIGFGERRVDLPSRCFHVLVSDWKEKRGERGEFHLFCVCVRERAFSRFYPL